MEPSNPGGRHEPPGFFLSFLLERGRRGWWGRQGDEVNAKVGADLDLLRRLGGHTTQVSSIKEEGSR